VVGSPLGAGTLSSPADGTAECACYFNSLGDADALIRHVKLQRPCVIFVIFVTASPGSTRPATIRCVKLHRQCVIFDIEIEAHPPASPAHARAVIETP